MEKHISTTNAEISESLKLMISYCLNSIVIPLFCQVEIESEKFKTDSLIYRVAFTWICIAFVHPLLDFYNLYDIYLAIVRFLIRCKILKCVQYEANM